MIAFIIGFSVKRVLLVKMYLVVYYTFLVTMFHIKFLKCNVSFITINIYCVFAVFISEKVVTLLQKL